MTTLPKKPPNMTKKADIQLQRIRYLRGPNIWTYRPVLEVWLDLGELEDHPSNALPGFNDRLLKMLPALMEHHCGVGERGGFIQRLEGGTWAGHILEHVVIELLNLARMPTGFGQTRSTSQRGVYRMVFRARDESVARSALAEGHRLLMAAINNEPFDVDAAVARLCEKVDDCYLGPSTAHIVGAATDRAIPHIRLNAGNLVQLGYGASQRRIWTAETEMTSAIAEGIAGDKDLTKKLLAAVGVPVPEGQVVSSASAAWDAAEDIGLPVVVKPTDGNHGCGVTMDLSERRDIEAAYDVALKQGSEVIVERFIRGHEHRLLVVGGRVVAASRGELATVTGDGTSSVRQLVDSQLNTDPRRGENEDFPLNRLDYAEDETLGIELQRQNLTPDDVPAAGRVVLIQRNGNLSFDCTDQVHADVEHAVVLAARVVGLDIAGVDLVCEDISKPLHVQGGAIVEVNAGPGLLMHLKPAVGAPRPVGRAIVDHLFPETEAGAGRIPIIGVAGSQDTHTISRLVAWLVHLSGRRVGLACRDGMFLDRRRVEQTDSARFDPAHRLLINRAVQAAVIENGAESILRDGLAYDRCQIGVVTDFEGWKSLANYDVQEADQMTKVLRTQVDVVLPDGVAVLHAADDRVADLKSLCDGSVILYALDGKNEKLAAHRAEGGRVAFMRDDHVVLATGHSETTLNSLRRGRVRNDEAGLARQRVQLAAVATAWAMGISLDLVAAGIETFDWDLRQARPVVAKSAR
jgi:cyanophycin synthetase